MLKRALESEGDQIAGPSNKNEAKRTKPTDNNLFYLRSLEERQLISELTNDEFLLNTNIMRISFLSRAFNAAIESYNRLRHEMRFEDWTDSELSTLHLIKCGPNKCECRVCIFIRDTESYRNPSWTMQNSSKMSSRLTSKNDDKHMDVNRKKCTLVCQGDFRFCNDFAVPYQNHFVILSLV